MKTSMSLAGLMVLLSLLATAAFSAPSSLGPTGILNIPTAEVVAPESLELMLAYDRPQVAGTGTARR